MTDRAPRPEGMSDERIMEIAAREAKATAGPWIAPPNDPSTTMIGFSDHTVASVSRPMGLKAGRWAGASNTDPWPTVDIVCEPPLPDDIAGDAVAFSNAEFIAHAREDVPDLLAECSRLRADGATLKVRADEAHAAHSASFGALSTLSAALFDGEVDDYAALAEKIIARVRQLEADGATLRERVRTREEAERTLTILAMEKIFNHPKASTWPYTEVRSGVLDLIFASAPKEPTPHE